VEDGLDEDQARAERLDDWIAWEAEERSRNSAQFVPFLSLFQVMLRVTYTPDIAHSALMRAEDFLSLSLVVGAVGTAPGLFLCQGGHVWWVYISLEDEGPDKRELKQTNRNLVLYSNG